MEVDKNNRGVWCENTTELDDIAYHLYIKDCEKYSNYNIEFQWFFVDKYLKYIIEYYNEANILLRREKINKILLRGNR